MTGMEVCIVILFIFNIFCIISIAVCMNVIDKLRKKFNELDDALNTRNDNFDEALDIMDRAIEIIDKNHSFVENTYDDVTEVISKAIESMGEIAIEAEKTAKMCTEMEEFCKSTSKKNELIHDEIKAFSEALEHINNVMRMNGLSEFRRNSDPFFVDVSGKCSVDTDVENG